jgi:L-alanine-DL-glutamate epimerase-like enolase superfamily enzyme
MTDGGSSPIAAVQAVASRELLLIGRRGLVLRALSAFDLAGWDLLGKQRGRSLSLGVVFDDVAVQRWSLT